MVNPETKDERREDREAAARTGGGESGSRGEGRADEGREGCEQGGGAAEGEESTREGCLICLHAISLVSGERHQRDGRPCLVCLQAISLGAAAHQRALPVQLLRVTGEHLSQ